MKTETYFAKGRLQYRYGNVKEATHIFETGIAKGEINCEFGLESLRYKSAESESEDEKTSIQKISALFPKFYEHQNDSAENKYILALYYINQFGQVYDKSRCISLMRESATGGYFEALDYLARVTPWDLKGIYDGGIFSSEYLTDLRNIDFTMDIYEKCVNGNFEDRREHKKKLILEYEEYLDVKIKKAANFCKMFLMTSDNEDTNRKYTEMENFIDGITQKYDNLKAKRFCISKIKKGGISGKSYETINALSDCVDSYFCQYKSIRESLDDIEKDSKISKKGKSLAKELALISAADCFFGVKKVQNVLSAFYSYDNYIDMNLSNHKMPVGVAPMIFSAMEAKKASFHNFLSEHTNKYGNGKKLKYDEFFSHYNNIETNYYFLADAIEIIGNTFAKIGNCASKYFKKAIDNNWLDFSLVENDKSEIFFFDDIDEVRIHLKYEGNYSDIDDMAKLLMKGYIFLMSKKGNYRGYDKIPVLFLDAMINFTGLVLRDEFLKLERFENDLAGLTEQIGLIQVETILKGYAEILFNLEMTERLKTENLCISDIDECRQKIYREIFNDNIVDFADVENMWKMEYSNFFTDDPRSDNFFSTIISYGVYRSFTENKDAFQNMYDAMVEESDNLDMAQLFKIIGLDLMDKNFYALCLDNFFEMISSNEKQ